MAERLGEALLDLDTDDRKFNQGVDRAQKRATGLGRVLDDTSRRAAQLGKTLAVAAGVSGAAALTAGIVGAVKRLEAMRQASAQVDQALKNSGNTARTSASELEAWADKLEDRTGRAAEEVMAVAANLASFGFGRDEFYRAIALADDMTAAWGGDLRQNLEGLSRALDDPINGMAMLSKRGIKLTDDQKAMAAAFLDAGNKVAAQGVVFDALEAQVKGVAEAGFGGLTKAFAQAQKRWDDAFESLVKGNGDTADLRNTLIELAETVSSPEFIRSTMGFAKVLIDGMDLVAKGVIGAWNLMEKFLSWLQGQNPSGQSADSLASQISELETLRDLAQKEAGKGGFEVLGLFGMSAADRAKGYEQQIAKLREELLKRSNPSQFDIGATFDTLKGANTFGDTASMWRFLQPGTSYGQDPFDPYSGMDTQTEAAKKQSDAVKALIADLEHERDIVGLSAQEQNILNTIRDAGVDAMSAEGLKIRELITETEAHRSQLEQMQEVYGLLGDIGETAIRGLVDAMADGQVEGKELLSILGDVLAMAAQFFFNQAATGMQSAGGFVGVLGDIFAGMFAGGGLIPNGSFGIVGENGPEPVWGAAGGTRVMSNPDFMSVLAGAGRGDTNVTINGSGLSKSELSQAIADALDRYDRFHLPSRVADIQADPYARG